MIEVEIKYVGVDLASLERSLTKLGAREGDTRQEADHYFNAPDRDFARTDEALRVRRIGPLNIVTYKGPKLDTQTKTRKEIEVPLADGAQVAEEFMQLLQSLGYRAVAVVAKRRRRFHLEQGSFPIEITLDEVDSLGTFAEIEIVTTEDQLSAARAVVRQVAAELGLTQSERRSYLELLLSARGG